MNTRATPDRGHFAHRRMAIGSVECVWVGYQPVEEVWHGLEVRVRSGWKPVPHPFPPVGNRCHTAWCARATPAYLARSRITGSERGSSPGGAFFSVLVVLEQPDCPQPQPDVPLKVRHTRRAVYATHAATAVKTMTSCIPMFAIISGGFRSDRLQTPRRTPGRSSRKTPTTASGWNWFPS